MSRNPQDLYRETILRHAKSPLHCSPDPETPLQAQMRNPLCGDEITVFVRVDEQARIQSLCFQAQCCSLCTASASMLSQELQGKALSAAAATSQALLLSTKQDFANFPFSEKSELQALQGVRAFPSRMRCVTLPWEAFLAAVDIAT